MNAILEAWNQSNDDAACATLLNCCAAQRWAATLAKQRPFFSEDSLYAAADIVWSSMEETDWLEAFRAHPRIGERKPVASSAQSQSWSSQEQASVAEAEAQILIDLADGNRHYEELFGFTYIVCATGKSAAEMLNILTRRLASDRVTELREAAEQQRQITQIRLRKWLHP